MEIERLHKMLTDAGIPHEWRDRTPPSYSAMRCQLQEEHPIKWGWQIIVYEKNGDRMISAIEGYGSYGFGNFLQGYDEKYGDLIEIMGLLTDEEALNDTVVGWLTAEEVFRRIKEAWDERNIRNS